MGWLDLSITHALNTKAVAKMCEEWNALDGVVHVYQKVECFLEARQVYWKLMAIAREIADPVLEAKSLIMLGDWCALRDTPQLTLEYYWLTFNVFEQALQPFMFDLFNQANAAHIRIPKILINLGCAEEGLVMAQNAYRTRNPGNIQNWLAAMQSDPSR